MSSLVSTRQPTTDRRAAAQGLGNQSACVWVPFLPCSSSVTLGKVFSFFKPASLLPTSLSFVAMRINEGRSVFSTEPGTQEKGHSSPPDPQRPTQPRPRTDSVSERSSDCFHLPPFRHEQVILWVRYIDSTSVGNSTCFSMSRIVSSDALSFDFFSLFIALVRTFLKDSLALLVFCLASFTSISLCSLVTLIKNKRMINKTILHTLAARQEFNITLSTSLAVCNLTLLRWLALTF